MAYDLNLTVALFSARQGVVCHYSGSRIGVTAGTRSKLLTSKWSTLPDLAEARHGAAVTTIGNTLYAIDGASQPGHNASTPTVQILHFGR
jgi:hypothetical protein